MMGDAELARLSILGFGEMVAALGRVAASRRFWVATLLMDRGRRSAGTGVEVGIAMPCLGLALDDPEMELDGTAQDVEPPSLAVIGEINERAYALPRCVVIYARMSASRHRPRLQRKLKISVTRAL